MNTKLKSSISINCILIDISLLKIVNSDYFFDIESYLYITQTRFQSTMRIHIRMKSDNYISELISKYNE